MFWIYVEAVVCTWVSETQVRSLGWEDALEKGMATHCSIPTWRTAWIQKPDGLQSMGS